MFVGVCEKYNINEVWVNFNNPFTRDHESKNETVYIVPTAPVPEDDYGNDNIARVFSPNWDSDDEDTILALGLWVFVATDWSSVYKPAESVRSDNGFLLLYKKGEGLKFW